MRTALFITAAAFAIAAHAADAPQVPHYALDPAKSTLAFSFVQACAQNQGRFTRFPVNFDFSPDNLAAGHLEVVVEMGSLDTGDQERDDRALPGRDFHERTVIRA